MKDEIPGINDSSFDESSGTGSSDVKGKISSRIQSISCDVFVVAIEVLCLILDVPRILSVKVQANRNNISGAYESIDPSQKSYLNTEMMIFVKTCLLKSKQSLIRKSSSLV